MHSLTSPPPTRPDAARTAPYVAFGLCALAYGFGGTASTLMATYLPVALPDLLGDGVSAERISTVGSYVSAAFLYGWTVGGLTFGALADRIGRVRALAFATFLYGAAMLGTTSVGSWPILLALRFLTGAGVGGVLLLSTVYLSEVWPASSRAVALGILAVLFPVGIVATGGLNVGALAWRQAFWIGVLPVLVAGLILTLPESSGWRETRYVAKVPGRRGAGPPSGSVWSPTDRANLLTGTLLFGAVLIGLWGTFSWIPTWVQSLLPAGQTGQTERGITMMLLGLGGIGGGIASGFLLNAFGPRRTLLLTFAGCAGGCALLFLTNRQFSPIIYGETALVALFFGISQGALSSVIPLLFPVALRATATGISFNLGRFFTATAVFFVGAMVAAFGGYGNALLTFSLAFFVAFSLVLLRINGERAKG